MVLDPKNPMAYNFRGTAKGGMKDYKGAIEDLDKAIKMRQNYSQAYINRAAIKFASGDKPGSCADLVAADGLGNSMANDLIEQYCNHKVK